MHMHSDPFDPATLGELRAFVEPLWCAFKDERHPGWQDTEIPSFGMCRFTAGFLRPVLADLTARPWHIRAGLTYFHPQDPGWAGTGRSATGVIATDGIGGMKGTDGVWHDHYWLTDGAISLDLTADQFGWDRVIQTDAGDARYLANWKPAYVARHIADVAKRASAWQALWVEHHDAKDWRPSP